MLNCDILQKIQKHQIFQVVIIYTAAKQLAFVDLVVTPFIVINNELFHRLLSYNMVMTLYIYIQVHMALGEYEEAKDCLQRTYKIRSRVYGRLNNEY